MKETFEEIDNLAEEAAKEGLKEAQTQGATHYICVPDKLRNVTVYGYIKTPTKAQMGAYMAMQANDPLGAQESLLRSCFVVGHPSILDDVNCLHVFLSAITTFAASDFLPVALGKVGR